MLLLCAYIEHQVYEKFTLFPEFAEEEEKNSFALKWSRTCAHGQSRTESQRRHIQREGIIFIAILHIDVAEYSRNIKVGWFLFHLENHFLHSVYDANMKRMSMIDPHSTGSIAIHTVKISLFYWIWHRIHIYKKNSSSHVQMCFCCLTEFVV